MVKTPQVLTDEEKVAKFNVYWEKKKQSQKKYKARRREEEAHRREEEKGTPRESSKATKTVKNHLDDDTGVEKFIKDRLMTKPPRAEVKPIGDWKKFMGKDRLKLTANCRFDVSENKNGIEIIGNELIDKRTYVINFCNEKNGKWHDLFEIKKSALPNSNMGLFAMKDFEIGDKLGVYYGDEIKPMDATEDATAYAMRSLSHHCIMDCKGSVTSGHRTYFGLHFANDPYISINPLKRNTRHAWKKYVHNFFVDDFFVAVACQAIHKGDELFLNYGWNDTKEGEKPEECKCVGCHIRQTKYSVNLDG